MPGNRKEIIFYLKVLTFVKRFRTHSLNITLNAFTAQDLLHLFDWSKRPRLDLHRHSTGNGRKHFVTSSVKTP